MKTFKTSALVALMTAAVGLSAIAPSYAQDATPPAAPAVEQTPGQAQAAMPGFRHHDGMRRGGQRQGGMAGFIGFERGAEAVEIALVRLSHAIDMTPEQQALFDTLKTDALAAADSFSSTLEGVRPAAPVDGAQPAPMDFSKALDTRIAIETAHLDALRAVQPSLTAFFDSLTDAQRAELTPAHEPRGYRQGHMGKMGPGERHHGQRHGHRPMGGQPDMAAPANG